MADNCPNGHVRKLFLSLPPCHDGATAHRSGVARPAQCDIADTEVDFPLVTTEGISAAV